VRPQDFLGRFLAFLAALIAIAAFSACRSRTPEQADAAPYEKTLQPRLEELMRRQEIPGLAVAIVDDGRVVYEHGFGVMDLKRSREPVTPRSLFHMASITKTFVATSVMQLVEKGRMRLDAPITAYLPYFRMDDQRAAAITVQQLLTHTSGMPDVADYEWDRPQYDDGALERYVRSLAPLRLVFTPGERFQYSNIAYEILGDAVAKVSGAPFERCVRDGILVPLKMTDSTLLVKETTPAVMTWGHELDGQGRPFVSAVYPYNRAHTPSSNLHSNVLDMTRWAIANLDGGELGGVRIIERATRDRMWTAQRRIRADGPDERREAIGLSWFLGEHRGRRIVSHGGGDTGYVTDLVLVPEGRKAVVWMANVDWMSHDPITNAALDAVMGVGPAPIEAKRDAGRVLIAAYREGGLDAALARGEALRADRSGLYDADEGALNELGYFVLGEKKAEDAVRVFRKNTEMFPKSANAQDSLGEACEAMGDTACARAAYARAVELDPGLRHAADALAALR